MGPRGLFGICGAFSVPPPRSHSWMDRTTAALRRSAIHCAVESGIFEYLIKFETGPLALWFLSMAAAVWTSSQDMGYWVFLKVVLSWSFCWGKIGFQNEMLVGLPVS